MRGLVALGRKLLSRKMRSSRIEDSNVEVDVLRVRGVGCLWLRWFDR